MKAPIDNKKGPLLFDERKERSTQVIYMFALCIDIACAAINGTELPKYVPHPFSLEVFSKLEATMLSGFDKAGFGSSFRMLLSIYNLVPKGYIAATQLNYFCPSAGRTHILPLTILRS